MVRRTAYSGTRIGNEMETTISRLNQQSWVTVAVLTKYEHTIDQTIAMLFPDEIIARSAAAKGIVYPSGWTREYELGTNAGPFTLGLNYEKGAHCLPIQDTQVCFNHARGMPLLAYIREVEKVYLQFEEVKGVLRWLNHNATLGAIRYYFPQVLKLCPATFAGMGVPSRHDTPAGIHDWLQPMRDAAATVVSAIMLPEDARPKERDAMWLTFASRKITLSVDGPQYSTDRMIFSI